MGSNEGQTYCLRWNNHKSNLVEILDALIKMESYVDCTIVVDDQVQFKAHRVVLAANSPYFQTILQDVPMDHCSILFPGVQAFEMRALLEYMYTGEVNVTQSQIPKIMKIAEQLEVKGLFDMTDLKEKFHKFDDPSAPFSLNAPRSSISPQIHHTSLAPLRPNRNSSSSRSKEEEEQHSLFAESSGPSTMRPPSSSPYHYNKNNELDNEYHQQQSSPIISTSTAVTSAQSSSSSSPPLYTAYKSPYSSLFAKSPGPSTSERHSSHQWSSMSSHLQVAASNPVSAAAAAMLSSVYETGSDMNPLKRKKLSSISSMLMSRDTPILRNVLAQPNIADSSQPMPLICQSIKQERTSKQQNTGNCNGSEYNLEKKQSKYDDPHSPYTDKSYDDDGLDCSPNYSGENRIASYVPQQQQQKPEWKRYKQYTRGDILAAIECVRNGMSALQASRKFGVPSRTLYDKVKKLGITTGRPMNRTIKRSPSNGSAGFPFGLSGTSSHSYGQNESLLQQMHEASEREKDREHHLQPTIPHPAAALLDASFLQQAFEARGGDIAGREALHAMALAAAAHAAVNGMSTSPGTNGTARSPSPSMAIKYAPPSPSNRELEHIDDLEDRVEDLSIGRKDLQSQSPNHHHSYHPASLHEELAPQQEQQGVIVQPMTKISTEIGEDVQVKREMLSEDARD